MHAHKGQGRADCDVCRRLRAGLLGALAARDLDSVRETDVATHAGVAGSAFATHYRNVHECMLATYEELSNQLYLRWARLLSSDGDWNERVERALGDAFEYFADAPGAARLFFVEATRVGDLGMQERRAADRQRLVRLLAAGYATSGDRTSSELRLEFLVGALCSMVEDGLAAGEPPGRVAERVRALLPVLEPAHAKAPA